MKLYQYSLTMCMLHMVLLLTPFDTYAEKYMSDTCENALKIVKTGDPVLRQKARELQKEEILSPYIQDVIRDMAITMREAPGVGLAAPQVGLSIQLAVIEDLSQYHTYLTPEQLKERDRSPVPFHVIINPKIYLDHSNVSVEFFEGCLSVNDLCGVVPRASSVRVECLNEHAEPVIIEAKGWYARILQHEIDHLNGILYLDRVSTQTLTSWENFEKYWKDKPLNELKVSKACACGTGKDYAKCCQALHMGALPGDALALMRSRYSAYAYGLYEYIIRTTDPDNINYNTNHVLWAKKISERCQSTTFQKLDILEFTNGSEDAYVAFVVHFIENNRSQSMYEKSRFRKIGPQWLYLEGEPVEYKQ